MFPFPTLTASRATGGAVRPGITFTNTSELELQFRLSLQSACVLCVNKTKLAALKKTQQDRIFHIT